MAWVDLSVGVLEVFAAEAPGRLPFVDCVPIFSSDPHPDADEWLAASRQARKALAPIYQAKLDEVIERLAGSSGKRKRQRAGYMRAWRAANRERENAKQREYRARKAAAAQ